MKTSFFWVRAQVVVMLTALLIACSAAHPVITSCKLDAELPTKDRESLGQVAVKFVEDTLSSTPAAAYIAFTEETKRGLSMEQFVSGFLNPIKARAPFTDLHVAHTYLAEVTGGSHEERVVCGDYSRPEGWVAVTAKPGTVEAYVIVEGQTVNNTNAVVLRLRPKEESWAIQSVHFATTGMVGKSADDLRKIAEVEQQRQHSFNAVILYTAALQLADRGPFLQLGLRSEIEKAVTDVAKPPILHGSLPFSWTFDKSSFKVTNVGPIGVGGKIYLLVDHEIEPWSQDKVADQKNRELIAALNKVVDEYKEAFAGLVIRAHERGGNRGFGTVHENDK